MRYKRRKGKKTINSKKHTCDGIQFKSGLELTMYKELKKHGIKCEYEKHSYDIMEGFHFPNESYERQRNGKGDMVNRGGKKVRGIKYTPDFVGDGFIIEVKGRSNEAFPNIYKLFKKYLKDNNIDATLYKPQRRSECEEVARMIKEKQSGRNS